MLVKVAWRDPGFTVGFLEIGRAIEAALGGSATGSGGNSTGRGVCAPDWHPLQSTGTTSSSQLEDDEELDVLEELEELEDRSRLRLWERDWSLSFGPTRVYEPLPFFSIMPRL
jgi:hypothetical protein